MRADFEQIGVRMSEQSDIARAAETIIAAHRIRQLTAAISGAEVAKDARLSEQCAIVGEYGPWLRLGVLRGEEIYGANVLSDSKGAIGYALQQCAAQLPLSEEEIALLGDMYCCLSYFYEPSISSENGDDEEFSVRSVAEGRERRLEWNSQYAGKSLSRFSKIISSWLRPNA